jgi:hypothetical protein
MKVKIRFINVINARRDRQETHFFCGLVSIRQKTNFTQRNYRSHALNSELQIGKTRLVLVDHICNPSYSGGRDQED